MKYSRLFIPQVFTLLMAVGCVTADPPDLPSGDNQMPVAAPGQSRQVTVGSRVTLDGSQSTDPDGDTLTFKWSIMPPTGSQVVLSSASSAVTEFTPDVVGEYIITLIVNDGTIDSAAASVRISAMAEQRENQPPVANPGIDRQVPTGTIVNLDGSQSTDPDNDTLTYKWEVVTIPLSSSATLQNPNTAQASFLPDVPGDYSFRLIVNDGIASSNPAIVTIAASMDTPDNQAPVAKAGSDRSVEVGTKVTLDGGASADPDNDTITFSWMLTTPNGSSSMLDGTSAQSVSFTPDIKGSYTATLVVNDGKLDSQPTTVTITATKDNAAPQADAGSTQSVSPGVTVQLDGSQSMDPDGDNLTYSWSLTPPNGSSASLSDATSVNPTFTADIEGTYVATLVVNDGDVPSAPATVVITAAQTCLLISEYLEGSSYNKAFELYNCGGQAIDLSRVGVCLVANSNTTCSSTDTLVGMLATQKAYTVCNNNSNIDAALDSKCDTKSSTANYNGDDRLVIFYDNNADGKYDATDTIMDAFGQTDTKPATADWKDITIRRCSTSTFDGKSAFDMTMYFSMDVGVDDFSDLGVVSGLGGC